MAPAPWSLGRRPHTPFRCHAVFEPTLFANLLCPIIREHRDGELVIRQGEHDALAVRTQERDTLVAKDLGNLDRYPARRVHEEHNVRVGNRIAVLLEVVTVPLLSNSGF